jgi:hypothetical protein
MIINCMVLARQHLITHAKITNELFSNSVI